MAAANHEQKKIERELQFRKKEKKGAKMKDHTGTSTTHPS